MRSTEPVYKLRNVDKLWKHIEDVYKAILKHPFIIGLVDGGLPMHVFKEYVIQDALYLSMFSRSVAEVGVKAEDDEDAVILLTNARDALLVERKALHEFLISEWGMGLAELSRKTMTPLNMAYTNYLLSTAYTRPFHEGLSAVLPCFWVYLEVGKELVGKGSPNKTYAKWIDAYSSKEYEAAVMPVVGLMDRVMDRLDGNGLEAVKKHFRLSTIYEYMFWDSAYRLEGWPFRP